MAKVFISHRTVDSKEAERLANDLEAAGHKVWLDTREINVGNSIIGEINRGLEESTYLVLCYSAHGVLSPWIAREWMSFLAAQLNNAGVKLLPVNLTGGEPPAILTDFRSVDLSKDWFSGVTELLRAIR